MEIFEYVVIITIFVAGMIPLVGGAIAEFQQDKRSRKEKSA
jgi:hypothetical protein